MRLFVSQGGKCFYCGCAMKIATEAGARDPETATFDHVIPISRGGAKGYRNVVLSCLLCNQDKSDRTPSELPA